MFTPESTSITRRDALKLGSLAAAGAVGASLTTGAVARAEEEAGADASAQYVPPFLEAPEPISDVADTKDYDVVVVGAGTAGMAAANKAAEDGAKVAVVQKLAMPSTQGFNAAGLITEDAAVRAAFVSKLMLLNDLRSKRSLLEAYATTSGEAIMWYRDLLTKAGCEIPAEEDSTYERDCNGYVAEFMTTKPTGTHAAAISSVADYAASTNGIDFYYEIEQSTRLAQ